MTDTPPPKPTLSDPMAEALAEDAAAEAARAAQAAAETQGATEEPPGEETPPTEPVAAAEPTEETPPAKKPAMVAAPLLAKERNKRQTAETALADAIRRAEAAEALLSAQGRAADPAADPTAQPVTQPVTPPVQPQRVYTEAEMQEAAKQYAYMTDLNARAEQVFNSGKDKFGDWVEGVANLNALEIMSPQFVEAVMDTGAPVDVIHHLSADLEEAQRISALAPVRMGVELAKIAQQVSAPAKARAISGAPAPIEPVNGRPDPTVDFAKLAQSDNMSAYVAARKAAGDPWAR